MVNWIKRLIRQYKCKHETFNTLEYIELGMGKIVECQDCQKVFVI